MNARKYGFSIRPPMIVAVQYSTRAVTAGQSRVRRSGWRQGVRAGAGELDGATAGVSIDMGVLRACLSPSPPASGGEGWGEGGQRPRKERTHSLSRHVLTPSRLAPLPRKAGERGSWRLLVFRRRR